MTDEAPPQQSLRTEAARQAIVLAFGIVGLIAMYFIQRKTGEDFAQAQRNGLDPDFARSRRMTVARRAERRWALAGTWLTRMSGMAWQRAEQARLAYEQERA